MRGTGITRAWGIVVVAGLVLVAAGVGAGWGLALAQHVHSHGASEGPGWLVALKSDARIPAIQHNLGLSDSQLSIGRVMLNLAARRAFKDGVELTLRYKAYELLSLLMQQAGTVSIDAA